jgi:hypothetical protein
MILYSYVNTRVNGFMKRGTRATKSQQRNRTLLLIFFLYLSISPVQEYNIRRNWDTKDLKYKARSLIGKIPLSLPPFGEVHQRKSV